MKYLKLFGIYLLTGLMLGVAAVFSFAGGPLMGIIVSSMLGALWVGFGIMLGISACKGGFDEPNEPNNFEAPEAELNSTDLPPSYALATNQNVITNPYATMGYTESATEQLQPVYTDYSSTEAYLKSIHQHQQLSTVDNNYPSPLNTAVGTVAVFVANEHLDDYIQTRFASNTDFIPR